MKYGVIATKIGAHSGDIASNMERFGEDDIKKTDARKSLNWPSQYELAMWPDDAKVIRDKRPPEEEDISTMCGNYCAIKIVNQ